MGQHQPPSSHTSFMRAAIEETSVYRLFKYHWLSLIADNSDFIVKMTEEEQKRE